jgi:dTMP kinase
MGWLAGLAYVGAMESVQGCFIVLEGGENAGKSTQAKYLAEDLGAVLTCEPGGTSVGETIRTLCLDSQDRPVPRAVLMLMLADRAHHVEQVLRPALQAGRHVICDRYNGSTVAYQGYGDRLGGQAVQHLCDWATQGLEPDLVLYLAVPPQTAQQRHRAKLMDQIEQLGGGFHDRVSQGFEAQAASRSNWVTIDGTGTPEQVHSRCLEAVRARLSALAADA